jgi:hypothetical protein
VRLKITLKNTLFALKNAIFQSAGVCEGVCRAKGKRMARASYAILVVLAGLRLAERCSGARILVANHPQLLDPITAHSTQMFKETGLSIEVAKSASLGSIAEEVRVDLGATAQPMDKYDGYCLKTTWVPELAQDDLLEELTPYIRNDETLLWAGKRLQNKNANGVFDGSDE